MEVKFLDIARVKMIHEDSIAKNGGDFGIRDPGLLESAVLTPQQKFSGNYLHTNIYQMAAAYLFHLCKNHPFVDGNKRVAAMTAIIFLDVNGIETTATNEQLYELVIRVASETIEKSEIAAFFQEHSKPTT
ncbi:type II toxin-antitoxin system death-on-curing family toxin [Blastopirellula marina]|uniref:Type II toxin-antitoxin system death-on-curing family toxin n=1 Tax=Blastopirellula marina TaxID=124 RepID=A0A2S8FH75_9BACT|nr:type II toxin-antitoxin system death-on-curing family toxin [Blastopirellula marina]PQO31507.1 type II toxin-antitoxin system death-on-curing family toxin [Blastopirellula marina]PTL42813.1 type II toxin-antitoxin system death-on-curing family toxin [Blastopirellula marina]